MNTIAILNADYAVGVAYDPIKKKIYFSSTRNTIYRASLDGNNLETVYELNRNRKLSELDLL